MQRSLRITPRYTTRALLIAVFTLTALSAVGQIGKHVFGRGTMKGFVRQFYVDLESNVPTWYSAIALLAAAALLAVIAWSKHRERDAFRIHWLALAILFAGLSMDEIALFHEARVLMTDWGDRFGGLLEWGWVLPGLAFVLIVAVSLVSFLRHLPASTCRRFLAAGCVFVAGAIGIEMLTGVRAHHAGMEDPVYAILAMVEELFEMLGVVIFIHALLDYIDRTMGGLFISFGQPVAPTSGDGRSRPAD